MPNSRPVIRTYSRYTRDAIMLMGKLIRTERIEQKLAARELAERAGISRGLLQRIEKGDPKCAIGSVFELASLLGIPLFVSDHASLISKRKHIDDKLTLLPKSVRSSTKAVKDDF